MPKVGKKTKSIKDLKKKIKRSSNTGQVWNVKEDEELTVRFLTEPDDWWGYEEFWDDDGRSYVPLADGEEAPDDANVSMRYLANVLLVENDRVVALKMPKSMAQKLLSRYDKHGTIKDRDYELIREGSGLQTVYDVNSDSGPSKFSFKKYKDKMLNLAEVLQEEWAKGHGVDDEDEEDNRPRKGRRRVKKGDDSFMEEDDDDDEDVDDEDEDDGGDEAQDEDEDYDEDELKEMSLPDVKALAKEWDIKRKVDGKNVKKADLIEAILDAQEEAEE